MRRNCRAASGTTKAWPRRECENQVAACLGLAQPGTCRRSIRAWQRSRSKPHEGCPQELPLSIKIPGEQRRSGMGAGVAAIDQRIPQNELQSVVRAWLGVGPSSSVAVAGPDADFRELVLQVLELKALFHSLLVEQLQIFGIHDGGRAVHQEQTVVGVRAQGIDDPGDIHRTDGVKRAHDAYVAPVLPVEHLGKGHCGGRRSRLRHLGDKALSKAGRLRSVVAGFVSIGEEDGRQLPDRRGAHLVFRGPILSGGSFTCLVLRNRRTQQSGNYGQLQCSPHGAALQQQVVSPTSNVPERRIRVETSSAATRADRKKRRPFGRPLVESQLGTLENLYVLSLPTLGPFDYVERDSLAFLQAAEAFRLNRRIVNEYVFPILTADKAVALRVIEPLNRSLFHSDTSSFDVDIAQFDRDVRRQGVR